jgi:hypothetical protein
MERILIACEESGTVRDAFIKKGHDAVSCDIIPTSSPGPHIQGDVLEILNDRWDMMIAFPPCTYLTCTGLKWFYHPDDAHLPTHMRRAHPRFPDRQKQREDGVAFFMQFVNAPISKIVIENPVGIMSTRYREPDQIIQPYEYGHEAQKATCLWLIGGLKTLKPTNIVDKGEIIEFSSGKRMSKWYADTKNACERSKTFPGIADAMADQWG